MDTLVGFCWVFLLIQRCATLHVGLPSEDWNTGSRVCSLALLNDVQDPKNLLPINMTLPRQKYNLTWTGWRVKYSRWTAFIGCSTSFTTGHKEEKATGSLDECVSYCSEQQKQYSAYKDMICTCFDSEPNIDESLKDCRQNCKNDSSLNFACSGGSSTMIFKFVGIPTDQIQTSKYATNECLARKKQDAIQYEVMDCTHSNGYVCKKSSDSHHRLNWYDYQNECLNSGNHILYGKNLTGSNLHIEYYWTPIFRTQQIVEDRTVSCGSCQCIAVDMTGSLKVKDCSEKLPFLCNQSCDMTTQEKNGNEGSIRSPKVSIFAVVGVLAALLLMIGPIAWCTIDRHKFRQRLYTEFLQAQSHLYTEFGGRYDYITDYDVMNIVTQQRSIEIRQYEVPMVSDDLRPNKQNGEDESGYLEPQSGYLEPSVNQSMFWKKVLANAKPSEVQNFLNRKNQNIVKTGERGNISSDGNKTVDETSRQTACTLENNYDLPSEIESCDL